MEITNLSAPNEKNRVALKNLSEDPIFIVFSDNPTTTRGIELEKAFKEAKVKYRKSKFVLIYFPDEKNGNAIPSANLFDKYYDGLQLLNNKESLSSFVSDELFRDCAFNLSADTLFAFDGSSLSQKGKAEIKKVSSQIKARTKELLAASSYLSISAHTDRLGSDSYNQTLSEKRLHAVLNELKNNSVDMKLIKEAKAFADHDYVLALYKGEAISEEEKEHILDRVSYYTGVSREYLIRHGLKIDDDDYRQEVLKTKGKAVSRYDGRVTRPLLEPEQDEIKKALWDDATADRYDTFFYAAFTGDLLPKLNVKLDRNFIPGTDYYMHWDKEEKKGTTAEELRYAMTRRPGMRAFFANGWFDLCTEFGYAWHTMDHAGLPSDRVFWKGYQSGHMIYLGEDNVHELCSDIRDFIQGKNPKSQF